MRNKRVEWIAKLGALSAISLALMYLVRFPIFPAAAYLEYDMADVPILLGTFMYGPIAGLMLTLVVSVLQWLLVSPASGWVGALMHFIATGGFVIAAGLIYKKKHTRVGAITALVAGTAVMTLIMIPLNLHFTVHYNGAPLEVVKAMLIPIIIPFNLIKGDINSIITFLVYKRAGRLLKIHSDDGTEAA